ncbi:hypothetical protein PG988_003990 [Apiospora saccharicola]
MDAGPEVDLEPQERLRVHQDAQAGAGPAQVVLDGTEGRRARDDKVLDDPGVIPRLLRRLDVARHRRHHLRIRRPRGRPPQVARLVAQRAKGVLVRVLAPQQLQLGAFQLPRQRRGMHPDRVGHVDPEVQLVRQLEDVVHQPPADLLERGRPGLENVPVPTPPGQIRPMAQVEEGLFVRGVDIHTQPLDLEPQSLNLLDQKVQRVPFFVKLFQNGNPIGQAADYNILDHSLGVGGFLSYASQRHVPHADVLKNGCHLGVDREGAVEHVVRSEVNLAQGRNEKSKEDGANHHDASNHIFVRDDAVEFRNVAEYGLQEPYSFRCDLGNQYVICFLGCTFGSAQGSISVGRQLFLIP